MSLIAWYPLNGNLNNYGLDDIPLTASGNPSFINNYLQLNGSIPQFIFSKTKLTAKSNISMSVWINASAIRSDVWGGFFGWYGTNGSAPDSGSYELSCGFASNNQLVIHYGRNGNNYNFKQTGIIVNSNKWYCLALTYDGTTISYYLNGTLKGTITWANVFGTTANLYIGAGVDYSGGWEYFDGYLRDLRYYDELLSQKEISRIAEGLVLHYKFDNNGSTNLNVLKNSTLINSSKPDDTTITICNDCQSYTATSEGLNIVGKATGISSNGMGYYYYFARDNRLTFGDPITLQCEIKGTCPDVSAIAIWAPPATVASGQWWGGFNVRQNIKPTDTWQKVTLFTTIPAQTQMGTNSAGEPYIFIGLHAGVSGNIIVRNLVLQYGNDNIDTYNEYELFDDYIQDNSGFQNNGTLITVGTPVRTIKLKDNPIGSYCAKFSDNSHIKLKSPLKTPNECTISYWIKPTTSGTYAIVTSNYNNPASGFWLAINCEGYGLWAFEGLYAKAVGGNLPLNTWYFITFVYNNGIVKWYKNGELVSTTDWSAKSTYLKVTDYIAIGNSYTGTSWNTKFSSYLADFKIYTTALSSETILNKYKSKQKSLSNGKLIGSISEYTGRDYTLLKNPSNLGTYEAAGKLTQMSENGRQFSRITCTVAGTGGLYSYSMIPITTDGTDLVNGKQYIIKFLARSANKATLTFNFEKGSAQTLIADKTLSSDWKEFWDIFTYNAGATYGAFTMYGGWAVDEYVDIANMRVYDYDATENLKFNKNKVIQCTDLIEELATNLKLTKQNTVITSEFIED